MNNKTPLFTKDELYTLLLCVKNMEIDSDTFNAKELKQKIKSMLVDLANGEHDE